MQTLRVRELYCPSHFGNVYEVAGRQEMRAILSEAQYWGFNRYADWFDTVDLLNPYGRHDEHYNLPQAVWAQKFSHYATAAGLGFDLGLVVTPNHVFLDQVTPENAAEHVPRRIFGQLVCPSKPGVNEMILGNYRRLFQDFVDRGLCLAAISFGAYDYGGCACPSCRPWIVTFGKLARRIVEVGREFFPSAAAELWGWWWTDEDHRAFTRWANQEAPGLFGAMAHYLPYGETSFKRRPVPEGCATRAFVHIGYGETRGIDVYGHYGPAIAPGRLEETVAWLAQEGADGFLAYSEDVCDDVNKAIVAGLGSGKYETSEAVLQAYAARCLGGDPAAWSAWLRQMGRVEAVDPARARRQFDRLAATARPSWRLDALACKLEMREADAAVRAETAWNEGRLAAAAAFWAAKERLWRQVWGRGLGRAILKFDWLVPDWYAEYVQQIGSGPGASRPASAEA
jgi:hypothetical protein